MRMAIVAGIGLGLLVAAGAEGQDARCFALEFPDSAPRYPKPLAPEGDTLVLSEMPLENYAMAGGRRAFLSIPEYRDPEPVAYHVQGWVPMGSDSILIHPVRIIYDLYWKLEVLDHGLKGEVTLVPTGPTYRVRAEEVPCPVAESARTNPSPPSP